MRSSLLLEEFLAPDDTGSAESAEETPETEPGPEPAGDRDAGMPDEAAGAESRDEEDASLQQEAVARLAALLDRLARDAETAAALGIERNARAFAAAAAACLPQLASAGFAAHLARSVVEIARASGDAQIGLRIHPSRVEIVEQALEQAACGTRFAIEPDAALGEDTAEIAWDQGGAEVTAEALAEAALGLLHSELGSTGPTRRDP